MTGCVGYEPRQPQLAADRRHRRSDRWPLDVVDAQRLDALDSLEAGSSGSRYRRPHQPPGDNDRLATAYRRLCAVANGDGVLREDTATSILATVLGIAKKETKPMILRSLDERGYLTRQSNVYGATSYHIAGWNN